MRWALPLGAAVALLFFLWRDEDPEARTSRDTPEVETEVPRERPAPAAEADPAPAPPAGLSGTVVVLDPDGTEHREEDGSFRLTWSDGGRRVVVTGGRWTCDAPPDDTLHVSDLRFGGRAAWVEDDGLRPVAGAYVVKAQWMRTGVLRVLDDGSGADLARVTLLRDDNHSDEVHPGGQERPREVFRHARSPLPLETGDRTRTYWVGAPGYAWQRIKFDHRTGGERVVRLVSGGALEVRLRNYDPESDAQVRLHTAQRYGPAVSLRPDGAGGCAIEGLRPGAYEVRVGIGKWWREPVPLGRAEARVVAGGRERVEITLEDPPARGEPVRLTGTVVVPAAWGKDPYLGLRLEAVGPGAARRAVKDAVVVGDRRPDGAYPWDAGSVFPGLYVVTLHAFEMQVVFDVPAGAEHVTVIEVPDPVDVTVKVVDDATGEPVAVRALHWNMERPWPVTGGSLEQVKGPKDQSEFTFRVPAGRVDVALDDDRWDADGVAVEARPGAPAGTLRVRRVPSVRIVLKDGKATVPIDFEYDIEAERLDGDGTIVGWMSDGTTQTLRLSAPGRYRFTFPAVPVFHPIEPRTVEVPAGRTVEITIPLRRR